MVTPFSSLFHVLLYTDGTCEVYSYDAISISPDPYVVTFNALNPDEPPVQVSETFTLTLFVVLDCYVAFEDKLSDDVSYDVTIERINLVDDTAVVNVSVETNCNEDDVIYRIDSEIYQQGKTFSILIPILEMCEFIIRLFKVACSHQ